MFMESPVEIDTESTDIGHDVVWAATVHEIPVVVHVEFTKCPMVTVYDAELEEPTLNCKLVSVVGVDIAEVLLVDVCEPVETPVTE
jgi:hypothetical protein